MMINNLKEDAIKEIQNSNFFEAFPYNPIYQANIYVQEKVVWSPYRNLLHWKSRVLYRNQMNFEMLALKFV